MMPEACPPPPAKLLEQVSEQCTQPMPDEVQAIVQALHTRLGDTLVALLVYGSCLRNGDLTDGLVDVYALVDSYAHAHHSRLQQLANAWLPPTVILVRAAAADGQIPKPNAPSCRCRTSRRVPVHGFKATSGPASPSPAGWFIARTRKRASVSISPWLKP